MESARRTLRAIHSNDGGGSFSPPGATNPERRNKCRHIATTDNTEGAARRCSQLVISRALACAWRRAVGGVTRIWIAASTAGAAASRSTPPGRFQLARCTLIFCNSTSSTPPQPELRHFDCHCTSPEYDVAVLKFTTAVGCDRFSCARTQLRNKRPGLSGRPPCGNT